MHVLLVEDNPADVELAKLRLADAGRGAFRVSAVHTLSDAMELLKAATPDAVLTDLTLPDAYGTDAVRDLRNALPSTPIVVVTGCDDDEAGLEAVRAGADDYLRKDELTGAMLYRTLRHAIERCRSEHELVEHIADGVLVIIRDGEVRFANPAAIDLLGKPASQLLGRSLDLAAQLHHDHEVTLGEGDRARTVEVSSRNIQWYGQAAALVTLRDVTERRRSDVLRASLTRADRLAAMGLLAASVAHEINNALAVLSINVPMLQANLRDDHGLSEESEETFEDCTLAIRRIKDIVRKMRDYGTERESEISSIDLNEIVRDAIALVGPQLRQCSELELSLGDVPRIAADAAELSQIVVNLLVNAADAVGESEVETAAISVATSATAEGVSIRIANTGPSIPDDIRPRIFDPFFTTKPKARNPGLGLAVVADLVRRRSGSIELASAPGGVTAFEVTLPYGVVPASSRHRHIDASGSIGRARVLLVEDDRAVRTAIARVMRGAREVVQADGGRAALAQLEEDDTFDAIVCDVMMPEMDGATFYAQLCARFPRLAQRVVFLTGGANTDRARKLLTDDVYVIYKPIEGSKLLNALEHVLTIAAH